MGQRLPFSLPCFSSVPPTCSRFCFCVSCLLPAFPSTEDKVKVKIKVKVKVKVFLPDTSSLQVSPLPNIPPNIPPKNISQANLQGRFAGTLEGINRKSQPLICFLFPVHEKFTTKNLPPPSYHTTPRLTLSSFLSPHIPIAQRAHRLLCCFCASAPLWIVESV